MLQDEDNMQDALRHSAAMLGELRTALLGPQRYYQLYVQVNDELRSLEAYFAEEPSKGRSFADLYQLVQHAGNVLPRLYLLCTVGACYIRSGQTPGKPLLRDMADMCKGVQHPIRGLFLRAYLVQVCRGLLPDVGSPYAGEEGGDVVDAVEFLLANFTEMNKLWVRMKLQGTSSRNTELRERERAQLADLVGKNLTQLSQLDGLSFDLYRDVVLPRVLEQVVACKDELAQGYLMQCVAAVFPDDFHVGTLDVLLGALPQLQPGIKLATVMGSLLERLAIYASNDPDVVAQLDATDAFAKMRTAVASAVAEHLDMPGADLAALYTGLLSFAGAVYPTRIEYVDDVLGTCVHALETRSGILANDVRAERQLVALLTSPLERYGIGTVLGLKHYASLLNVLTPSRRREMGRRVAEAAIRRYSASQQNIDSPAAVKTLFEFLGPVAGQAAAGADLDEDDIKEDAALLARVINTLRSSDAGEQYEIVDMVLPLLIKGGTVRAAATIPPLCFVALEALRTIILPGQRTGEISLKETTVDTWYRFLHRAASALADARAADLALEIFLIAAVSASQDAKMEVMAYECFEQAFTLFEESIPDSRQEVRALESIIGAVYQCHVFDSDNRTALVHKASAYCARLLRRADQCMAMLACAHLYWQEKEDGKESSAEESTAGEAELGYGAVNDGKGVLACLKRALKFAHAAQQQLAVADRRQESASVPGQLFVEILNAYLYFFDRGVAEVTAEAVQGLLELSATELNGENCRDDQGLQAFYKRTLAHVQTQKKSGDSVERYIDIKV